MDTWLPVHTLGFCPLLQHVVRSFRLHHAVPYKFGSSDFYATNGKDVIMVFPPLAAVMLYLRFASSASISANYWWCVFACVTSFFFGLNSQFHKYAHQKKKAPWFAQVLQRIHIFLPPSHHNVHHTLPYDRHYCVISGLMNYQMDVLRVWRIMEYVIGKIFRCQPRSDDAHHRYGTPPKQNKHV
uniref:Transmembrane protein 189 n=1 Tax=Phallusia mammillata TaxID=59560 RepID=A0A6F9DUF5_9ASCI|nr:transmembrane protein 189 [Phallusia mammillata]